MGNNQEAQLLILKRFGASGRGKEVRYTSVLKNPGVLDNLRSAICGDQSDSQCRETSLEHYKLCDSSMKPNLLKETDQ